MAVIDRLFSRNKDWQLEAGAALLSMVNAQSRK